MSSASATTSITVREASIDTERAEILEALHRFLTPYLTAAQNEARFTWLYRSNPHGTSRVWTARGGTAG